MFLCCACNDKESSATVEVLADRSHLGAAAALRQDELLDPADEPYFLGDPPPPALTRLVTVQVVGAGGFRPPGRLSIGHSSAGCCCTVTAGPASSSTRPLRDAAETVWNQELTLTSVQEGTPLEFSVWDEEGGKKQMQGKAVLQAQQYEDIGFCGELELQGSLAGAGAFLVVKVRTGSRDYPPPLGIKFTVTLEKPEVGALGLDVDLLDEATLHVTNVHPGVIASYNETAPKHQRLLPGLFIVGVNGISVNAPSMVERLQHDRRLTFTLHRPMDFCVPVDKSRSDGSMLGLDLHYSPSGISLLVLKVNYGLVEKWNESHPEQAVRRHDRIIAVNGLSGDPQQLYELMKTEGQLHLQVSRRAEPGWWRWS